ncbi:MAG: helix-turn-helix domain-containing protein [Acidobacteria bacterium]|jgi:transcriptional regulator with XRE-family HTH domain|nr:helix-turn-helix domain-containing protein [Acidobacteriota bacterium]
MNKETPAIDVGNRIKQIRKAVNLQQKDFAVRLEVSGPSLSEIESGKYKPGFDFLVKLSQEFDVNLHYVLFGEGAMFLGPGRRFVEKVKSSGGSTEDVRKFLWYFERSSIIHYYILSAFKNKLLENKANIDREVEEYESNNS